MSVSHAYLKQLKVHILRFCQHQGPVRDDHPSLLGFFRTLEDIIRDGLRGVTSKFSTDVQRTYWEWMKALLKKFSTRQISGQLQISIEYAKNSKKAIRPTGKGRLLIRCILNKGLLAHCLKLLRQDKQFLIEYYDEMSILGDDILSELLLSLLAPLESNASFSLNIRNCSFLDETWELPWFRRYEMVPCKRLGVQLQCVEGRLVVLEVEPGSVADEDLKIEPGDLIDDLFGVPLRRSNVRKAITLMEDFAGSPIYVSVVKAIGRDDTIYRPLFAYLEEAGLCKQALFANRERRLKEWKETGHSDWGEDSPEQGITGTTISEDGKTSGTGENAEQTESGLYKVKFWGYLNVGKVGTVEQIETGVGSVVRRDASQKREGLLELGETDVTVYCAKNNTVLLQHGYPEISSCGRRVDYPMNFAYIAGETTCTLAKKFTCFVFEAVSDTQAKAILKGIAAGFERTHWAV